MDRKKEDGWQRKLFKGNKVWMETDDAGHPLVKDKKVRIKYQLDQPHEYLVYPKDIHDIDDIEEPPPAPPVSPQAREKESLPAGTIFIHTDGASSGNPGPAGIGVVLRYGEHKKEISKFIGTTTNNVAELEAVRTALLSLNRRDMPVRIYTDSSYVWGLLEKGWQAKKNLDLVSSTRELLAQFKDVQFIQVPGHSGVPDNERADRLAVEAIETSGKRA